MIYIYLCPCICCGCIQGMAPAPRHGVGSVPRSVPRSVNREGGSVARNRKQPWFSGRRW